MTATTLDGVLLHGVAGSRPAASAVAKGTLYFATDTNVVSQSDGVSTWTNFITPATNPLTTTGDIIYSSSGATAARLAVGTATQVLHGGASVPAYSAVLPADLDVSADNTTANSTTGHHGLLPKLDSSASKYLDGSGAWSTPTGSGSITSASATCTADTNMSTGNFVDITGMSITLATGTWFFVWHVSVLNNSATHNLAYGKVYDGSTTIYDESSYEYAPVTNGTNNLGGNGVAVLGGSTTLTVAARGTTGDIVSRNRDGGSSNLASQIWAIKVA